MSDTQNPTCLDAETLAAWVDGGLSGSALVAARTHVADCARCQAIVAVMVRTEAAGVAPAAERPARGWLGWLVPLAAAATAVAIWVAVPRPTVPDLLSVAKEEAAPVAQADPRQPADADLKARAATPAAPAEGRREAVAKVAKNEAEARNQEKKRAKELDDPARDRKLRDEFAQAAARGNAAAAATPPTVAAEKQVGRLDAARAFAESVEIVSPDPLVRWRIRAGLVERSSDAGKTWDAVTTGVTAELTTGASPSATVCWLVGRAGAVLLTTDGRTWRRVTSPDTTDLSAVRATDARSATVTTADGREWTTTDGGATWIRRLVQGF